MKKLFLLLILIIAFTPAVSAVNLDFRLDVNKEAFYPNEKVHINVTIINRDEFSAKNAVLTVHISDRFYNFDLGDVNSQDTLNKDIALSEFPPGTQNIEGNINYAGFLGERFTETTYNAFEVLFPPVERYPRNVYVSSYNLPDKILAGKEYNASATIKNDGEVSANLLIEFGYIDEFFSEEVTLNAGESKTVSKIIKFNNPGVSLLETRVYALINGEKYLLNYRGKGTYTQEERVAKLSFDRIELVDESDNQINQDDTAKLRVFIKNDGETATGVIGELSSDSQEISVLNSSVSYTLIEKGASVAPQEGIFKITTKKANKGNYNLILKLNYADSENREKSIDIPITINEGGDTCAKDADCSETQTCKNAQCIEIPCECGEVINRKCISYECCSDTDCNEDLVCNSEKNKCEVPITFKKEVLIITVGNKLDKTKDYNSALKSYQDVLQKEGLSSYYIELDSPKLKTFFNVELKNAGDWKEIRDIIDKIVYKTQAKYILILGGVRVIPQPPAKTEAEIPIIPVSDDVYSDLDLDGIPDIALARIPIDTASGLSKYLNMLSLEHKHQDSIEKLIVTDKCGGSDCFLKEDVDYFSPIFLKEDCDNSQKCLPSPPYCSGRGTPGLTPIPCEKKQELFSSIKSSNLIFFGAHGDGRGFYAVEDNSGLIADTILSGNEISTMNFDKKKIMSFACFGGTIDVTLIGLLPTEKGLIALYPKANPLTSSALASINSGASLYVGNTRFGYGYTSVRLMSYFYKNLERGQTVGEAFLDMKRENLKNSYSDWKNAVIYEIQLYGDPTLKIKI